MKPPPKDARMKAILEGEAIGPWPDSPQERALESSADIVIYGGAAGGGKSYALLLAAMRGHDDPAHRGVIFRRTHKQLDAGGGLIDEARAIYGKLGGEYHESKHRWSFPEGARISFSHLQHEKDIKDWDGPQLSFVGFDQLEQFTQKQFIHLVGRLRRPESLYEPQLFATCNPAAKSHWLYEFVEWWLDEDGFPDDAKTGRVRYFFREDDAFVWVSADARDDEGLPPTSVAFIPAKVEDNPAITQKDPRYIQRLNSYGRVERQQKRFGQWGVSQSEGMFADHRIQIVTPESVPDKMPIVRYWDMADNDGRGAATASAKIGKTEEWRWCCQNVGDDEGRGEGACLAEFPDGEALDECPDCGHSEITREKKPVFWVLDVTEWWVEGDAKEKRMERTAAADGTRIDQGIEQEPGSAGKRIAAIYADKLFGGHTVHIDNPTGSKTHRAKVLESPSERGRMRFVQGAWNERAMQALEDFPNADEKDIVDCLSGGCGLLEAGEVRGERELALFF